MSSFSLLDYLSVGHSASSLLDCLLVKLSIGLSVCLTVPLGLAYRTVFLSVTVHLVVYLWLVNWKTDLVLRVNHQRPSPPSGYQDGILYGNLDGK